MKFAIVSLPITPRQAPKLGLMLVPYIGDVISKKMGISHVLGLNVNGLKLDPNDIESNVSGYLSANAKFGITPEFVWRDDQQENVYWIGVFFSRLEAEGFIVKEARELLRCPCGVVETLVSANNISGVRRLYETNGGEMVCRVCGGSLVKEVAEVYLFNIPSVPINDWHITPEFTKREMVNMAERFTGLGLLVSRTRDSAIPLWTGKEHIFLDADFGWQMYLPILSRFGYQPVALIGGQKNLLGCYLAMVLSYLIDKTVPELVVPAYCKIANERDGVELNAFGSWDRSRARLFMASHCTFQKKEVNFDLTLLRPMSHFLRKMVQQSGLSKECTLVEALQACEGKCVRKAILEKRARHSKDEGVFWDFL